MAGKMSAFEINVKYIAKAIKSQLTISAYGNFKLILKIYCYKMCIIYLLYFPYLYNVFAFALGLTVFNQLHITLEQVCI